MKELEKAQKELQLKQVSIRNLETDLLKMQIEAEKLKQQIISITNYLNHDVC